MTVHTVGARALRKARQTGATSLSDSQPSNSKVVISDSPMAKFNSHSYLPNVADYHSTNCCW